MAHTAGEELRKRLDEATTQVAVGARYAHYKHLESAYVVTGLALLEADEEVAVIYEQEAGEKLAFIRPLKSFLEEVEYEGRTVPRFTRI